MDDTGKTSSASAGAAGIEQSALALFDRLSAAPLQWRLAIAALATVGTLLLRVAFAGVLGAFSGHYIFYPAIVISALLCGVAGGAASVAAIVLFGHGYLDGLAEAGAEPGEFAVLVDFLVDAAAYIALARLAHVLVRARRASEELVRINAEQLGHFVEQAPAAVAMFDRDMRYIASSARWRETEELDGDVVGKSHYDTSPLTPDTWKDVHRRALAGESARSEQELLHLGDGAQKWLRWEVRPWTARPGQIGGVVIFAEDISDRVRIQQALHENERRLHAIFEGAMDAIVTFDRAGSVLSANPAARELFGCGGKEMIGRKMSALAPAGFAAEGEASAATSGGMAPGRRRTVQGLRNSGASFPMELTVSEALLADGPIFVGVMRDLSPIEAERRRVNALREELAHVSRLNDMGEMVAGLAHEVAQPVAAILNFSAAYRRALATTGKAPEADLIGKIEDQARRAAEILKRLRGFIEKRPAERRAVGIEDLIDDALKLATLRSHPQIRRPPPPADAAGARICVDPIQIEQVLVNLLRNADDAMIDAAAPEIVIETGLSAAGLLRLSVADNGAGVDAEAVAGLFDPFFTTKPFGTGMGLSISKGIVESHGGSMSYRRNAPTGAIFSFELPVEDQDCAPQPPDGA